MKVIKYLGKFVAAGITAMLILSLVFSVYYLIPLRVDNPDQNTDYKWESNALWMRMEEGISTGKYDANGFNNATVVDNPDVLLLGSSHMEAANVPQNQNTGFYLAQMLDGDMSVYNMGISGHTFAKICQYLPRTMQVYDKTPKYIVIETGGTSITEDDAQEILNHSVPKTTVSHNSFLNLLQRSPFFRVLYYQYDGGLKKKLSDARGIQSIASKHSVYENGEASEIDHKPYDKVFEYLQSLQEEYGTQILIMYHPTEQLNSDGSVTFPHDDTYDAFSESAEKYNIKVIDTTTAFERMASEKFQLPHGFFNGKLGVGHLNGNGHYVVAESIYSAIQKEEANDADH